MGKVTLYNAIGLCVRNGAKGIRTPGLLNAIQTRYQLRHSPVSVKTNTSYHIDKLCSGTSAAARKSRVKSLLGAGQLCQYICTKILMFLSCPTERTCDRVINSLLQAIAQHLGLRAHAVQGFA